MTLTELLASFGVREVTARGMLEVVRVDQAKGLLVCTMGVGSKALSFTAEMKHEGVLKSLLDKVVDVKVAGEVDARAVHIGANAAKQREAMSFIASVVKVTEFIAIQEVKV